MAAPASIPRPLLRATVRNRAAEFECEPEDYGRLEKLFSYRHPNAEFIPSFQNQEWDGQVRLIRNSKVAAGLFYAKREKLEKYFRLEVDEQLSRPTMRTVADPSLRPYQRAAIEAMINAPQGGIILSATGSGKTKLAGSYFKRLMGKGIFIVDDLALLEQSRREISAALGEPVGIVGKSLHDPQRVTVATVQTLNKHRRKKPFRLWFTKIDVLIIDELHVQINRRNFDVVTTVHAKAVFGLTATLQMKKPHVALPAIALCGPVIFEYKLQQGVEEGYLSKGVIFIVPFTDPLRGVAPGYWTVGPNGLRIFVRGIAAEYRRHICMNKARNNLIERLVRANLNRKIFVLVERQVHLKVLRKRLTDLPHCALSGLVDTATRMEAMRQMDAGQLNLILATRVFAKGVNVKSVDCIIDATGKPSRNNVLQRYGRGARKTAGKTELHFYDIADRGSKFSGAAWARFQALKEIGAPIIQLPNASNKALAAAKAKASNLTKPV